MDIIFKYWPKTFVFVFFICQLGISQKEGWKVTQYDENIIKVSFQPEGYQKNENVSDAVILKQHSHVKAKFTATDKTITLGTKNPIKITYLKENENYQGLSVHLAPKEKIFGGGERALPLNRRGFAFNLDNNPWYGYAEGADNLNYSVPFFTSSNGYGLFFDNGSKGIADIGKSQGDQMKVLFCSGELNVYIIYGRSPAEILAKYHKLTGKQGLVPRWALGNFMSRFGYASEVQVKDIAAKMKKEKIPFDAIIFDLFWFGDSIKGTMGNLDWVNKERWPDPKAMLNYFSKDKIKTILITEPFILQNSKNYGNALPYLSVDENKAPYVLNDFYFGKGGLIDIFKKDARQWFWEKHDAQNKIGVAAWWGDLGEPEKHPTGLYHDLKDLGHDRLFRSDEVHNIYGHYWTKMLFEKYAENYPDTRLFSLNRSGFAGSQRYNIIPWSGDVSRSWSGLRAQLPIMLGMSMSGVPYIHADAGGFAGGEGDHELYVRWLQFAAFTPVFRPHGTALFDMDPAAYSFPSEPALMQSPYKEIARDIIRLRYKMLPYNYTLAYEQAKSGVPLVAPMYFYHPNDSIAAKKEDQFYWGTQILVAPVINKNQKTRRIYLPANYKWYQFETTGQSQNESLSGEIVIEPALDEIPVFVKEGSFIPVIDKLGATSEDYTTDSLTVHYYYSDKTSSYIMFDDDGLDKNSLLNNRFELLTFSASPSKNKVKIKIRSNDGLFEGKPETRFIELVVHSEKKFKKVSIKGKQKNQKGMTNNIQTIKFDFNGKATTIILKE